MSSFYRVIAFCALSNLGAQAASAECSADVITAFKDKLKIGVVEQIYEKAMDTYCESKSINTGGEATLPVDGIPIGASGNFEAAADACSNHKQEYFKNYALNYALEFMDEDTKKQLIASCFGGQVAIEAKETTGTIIVTIMGRSREGNNPKITDFLIDGADPITDTFERGDPLVEGGTTHQFTRTSARDVTISVNTDIIGQAKTTVPGLAIVPVEWDIKWAGQQPGALFACYRTIGADKPRKMGEAIDARDFGLGGIGYQELDRSICSLKEGARIAVSPTRSTAWVVPDRWDAKDIVGAPGKWQCWRNGRYLGDVSCLDEDSSSRACTHLQSRQAHCVYFYASRPPTPSEDYDAAGLGD